MCESTGKACAASSRGLQWLLHFCDELMDQVERYRYISMTNTDPRRDPNEEHRLIADAALTCDARLAAERPTAQYRLTLELIEEHLQTVAGA